MDKQNKKEELHALRHSCAHILASAVTKLYPDTKLGIGPAIDSGFYYDFDFPKGIEVSEKDFPKIEKEMEKIILSNHPFKKSFSTIKQAIKDLKKESQEYTVELVEDLGAQGEKKVSFYQNGNFTNLCKGPHLKNTGEVKAFKLLSIAGAYWRGNEKNKMLTRIYGTCFPTQKELDEHLINLEEAKKRDHRKIGKELDWFSFHPSAPADVFWHPKGWTVIQEMYQYWRKVHLRENYQEVRTPEILTRKIWDQSGHTAFFIEKMYKAITPDSKKWNMAIKPMNCDGGIMIYKSRPRSYRDFPLRMGELGIVHRYEASGETHGILRTREFTQDDAHIYCTPDQVKDELKNVINLSFEVYKTYGLEVDRLELSTRPEKSIGSDKVWERAEAIMRQVLKEKKLPHQINEGDGAFYGPKFDFHLKDSLGRTWQCATIQLDFAQPKNFNLEYTTDKGNKEQPVMIHRTLYGSVERFLGIVIEHYAGNLPIWLHPLQVKILPITENQIKYGQKVLGELKKEGIRAEMDTTNQTLSYKIRQGQLEKVPFLLIIGPKEEKEGKIAIRQRNGKDLGTKSLGSFIKELKQLIEDKSLKLLED